MNEKVTQMKGKLIVSCQALPDEPLHSSFIMGRMALAAKEGGAFGIRANTKEDIREIQSQVDLPIIGIVKRDYEDSSIYITPTEKEVNELMEVQPEIIAVDATARLRPGGLSLADFFSSMKEKYPNQLWMADCSTVEEALYADSLGFDFIGTTMVGYTPQSKGLRIEADDFMIHVSSPFYIRLLWFQCFSKCACNQLRPGNNGADDDAKCPQFNDPFCFFRSVDISFSDYGMFRFAYDLA